MQDDNYFKDELKDAFLEHFDGIVDEDGDRNPDYEVPQYWQDGIHEIADQAIPLDRTSVLELWTELDYPEIDDPGLIEGVTDIVKIVQWTIYEYATGYLYELANEYGLE